MRTINIKGKEYAPVNERVKEFIEKYASKGYYFLTEIVELSADSVVCKCTVYSPEDKAIATGYAQEDRSSSNINKTSYVENCETSAVGRALGMIGIGIDAAMASADEVANAIDRQEAMNKKVGETHIQALQARCLEKGSDMANVMAYFKVEKPEDFTIGQWDEAMRMLGKKK